MKSDQLHFPSQNAVTVFKPKEHVIAKEILKLLFFTKISCNTLLEPLQKLFLSRM